MTDEIYIYLEQEFEWNMMKAARNAFKHRVRFTDAATVFFDRNALFERDEEHSDSELHYIVIGRSVRQNVLLVVHVIRESDLGWLVRGMQRRRRGVDMKNDEEFEMKDEYDFSNAIRNPYFQRFEELHLVSLAPDVFAVFSDSDSVNEALRLLIKAGRETRELEKAS